MKPPFRLYKVTFKQGNRVFSVIVDALNDYDAWEQASDMARNATFVKAERVI